MWLIDTSTGNAAWSKADPDQFAMVERMQEIHAIYQHQCEQVAKIKAFQALQLVSSFRSQAVRISGHDCRSFPPSITVYPKCVGKPDSDGPCNVPSRAVLHCQRSFQSWTTLRQWNLTSKPGNCRTEACRSMKFPNSASPNFHVDSINNLVQNQEWEQPQPYIPQTNLL